MSGKKSMIAIALLLAISILALLFVSGNIHMESEQKDALKITFLKSRRYHCPDSRKNDGN